jgi:hypothetical protein
MQRPISLYDYRGKIRLWIGSPNWIVDMDGMPAAYIEHISIYSVRGLHLAWWEENSVLAHDGSVLLVTRVGNPWVHKPVFEVNRLPPVVRPEPPRPALRPVPGKSNLYHRWIKPDTLLDQIKIEQLGKRRSMIAG